MLQLKLAQDLVTKGLRDEADWHFVLARDWAQASGDVSTEAWAWRGLAASAYQHSQFIVMHAANLRALALFQSPQREDEYGIADTRMSLGSAAETLGDFTGACELFGQAETGFARALVADNRPEWLVPRMLRGRVFALLAIGDCPSLGPRQTSARAEAIELVRAANDSDLLGRVLATVGDDAFNQGDYAQALALYDEASAILRDLPAARRDYARLLTSQGRLQRALGFPRDAIPYYERALALQQDGGDPIDVIQTVNAIGVAHTYQGEHDKAGEYYLRALRLAEQSNSPRVVDFMRGALATNAQIRGRHAEAVTTLESIIRRGKDAQLSFRHQRIVHSYLALGRIDDALAAADKAVELAGGVMEDLQAATLARARARTAAGQIEAAQADLRVCLERLDGMRANLPAADFYKRGFSETTQQIFDVALELQMAAGETEAAFETAERARARAFLDLLATRAAAAPQAATVPVAARPATASSPSEGAPVLRAGETIASTASLPAPTLADVRALARRLDATIVSYWVSPTVLFTWVVAPDGAIRSTRVPVDAARLSSLVSSVTMVDDASAGAGRTVTRNAASAADRAAAARARPSITIGAGALPGWSELHRLLIAPIESSLPANESRLVILPHGPLLRLSFAALRDARGRYLLERFRLQYAPSAGVLAQLTDRNQPLGPADRILVVADPALPPARRGQPALAPLPAARVEAQAIADSFSTRASVLTGARATRTAVQDGSRTAAVVHFATHALVRDNQPFDSFLQLAGASDDDGRLRVSDIYEWRLPAHLVVLSACRSGQGAVTGDGMNGLARAFFSAGASALVAAQWEIADEPSRAIMTRFFSELARGRSRDEALRAAQVSVLQELRASGFSIDTPAGRFTLSENPSLWAGFVLIGAS